MIQFLTSTSTVRLIEQIVVGAEDNLVLVSPSPIFSRKLAGQLQDACQRGVSIELIVDDILFDEGMLHSLTDLDQFRILRCRDLSAQLYLNESTMIITTMAITDLPPTGIHFGFATSSDESAYSKARESINSLKAAGNMKITDVRREFERSDARKPRGPRSPLMRVVRGSLRKRFSGSQTGSQPDPVCAICNEPLLADDNKGPDADQNTISGADHAPLCVDCERRKKYQHTSLYLAAGND